jgi:hypothetical protein
MIALADAFAKLKKEFQYHEKRMSLLLSTPIAEDFAFSLDEKSASRSDCLADCKQALAKLEGGATEGKLSGRWTELRVASTFGLELPLTVLVGSEKFDKPIVTPEDIASIVRQLQSFVGRFSELTAIDDPVVNEAEVKKFLRELDELHWGPRDMVRIREAVASKLAVLTELEDLSNVLQQSQLSLSNEQTALESLRRVEEAAIEDGEMATSDAAIRDKMQTLAKIIDLLFFQAHTIDSSINTNVTKRKSNLALFQSGASMLDCIKREKKELGATCAADLVKLQRGVEYDAMAAKGRNDPLRQIRESNEQLAAIDERQKMLSARLKTLFAEFSETETALRELSIARATATANHLELLESSRHMASERMEMLRFADDYRRNLERTEQEQKRSVAAIESLEKVLLQQQSFDEYDFKASSRRLATMQRRVCVEMNRSLNEFETCAAELMRRLIAHQRQLEQQIEMNTIQAELRSETFDPITKKYVTRAKALVAERQQITADCEKLREMVHRQRDACLAKISAHLDKEEILSTEELTNTAVVSRHEELLDFRQELITPPEVGILDERHKLLREVESNGAGGGYKARRAQASKVQTLRSDVSRGKAIAAAASASAFAEDEGDCPRPSPCDVSGDIGNVSDVRAEDKQMSMTDASASVSFSVPAPQSYAAANEQRSMQYRPAARVIGQPLSTD